MTSHSVRFGYLPRELDVSCGHISISTLPGLDASIDAVTNEPSRHKDWLYSPPQQETGFGGGIRALPYPARIFGLPKTHELTHTACSGESHQQFLVWCLGFFEGLRLTTTERGFLDSTPLKPGALTDFSLAARDVAAAIDLAESFWQKHRGDPRRISNVEAIIHVLFLSQHPRHLQFEEFMYLYSALDACFAVMRSTQTMTGQVKHADRVRWMCEQYQIAVPSWADSSTGTSSISKVRNDSFHEALFFNQPLGFSIYQSDRPENSGNVLLEMQALICRLLVAILGRSACRYVSSRVDTRQIHRLDLS